jgi:nitrate reductase gamma subunit
VTALAGGIATVSAMLGASVVAIALGEMCVVACVVAFTLLIWAAIQDGKQADRAAVE